MHALKLAVNLSGWRIYVSRKQDKAFLPVAKRIYERDSYTCQFCAFQAKEFQEIINLDGNYQNNKSSNMATACCFCVQCLFLQAIGLDENSGGQLIYLPEINQNDLNSFCHVLFCAMGNNTGYQETAQLIYRSLKFRSQQIENTFGAGMSQPDILAHLIVEYQEKNKTNPLEKLSGVCLLPSHIKFKTQLDAWAAAALEELAAEENSPT
jgi:intracellular multiplication protein IcmJ